MLCFIILNYLLLPEPGCKDKSTGSEEWLQINIGIFLKFATIKELKEMNNNFSAVSDLTDFQIWHVS